MTPHRSTHPPGSPSRRKPWLIASAIVVALGIAVGIAVVGIVAPGRSPGASDGIGAADGNTPSQAKADEQKQALMSLARRTPKDMAALGEVDAPVVLIEYADYRCPFCALFARDTMPALVKEYVDAGTLRIEWRDLPVFGEESMQAAVAVRAAGRQGKFWQMHRLIYADAPERGHPDLPMDRLTRYAEEAGVADLDKFTEDMSDPDVVALVRKDMSEAASIGAQATPLFLINGTPVAGAQPVDVFRKVIDAELAQASR